jgi:adenylate cyclase
MSNPVALVQTIAPYVPLCLVRQILTGSPPSPGEIAPAEAAVLFADISGFTPMAEALARAGRQGAEEMNRHLNGTFSATIAHITAYGGEVAAFGGDAILAFFPRQGDETARRVAWRALNCALEMRQTMESFAHIETLAGPFSLRMKFGLSFGRILIVNVGSRQYGLEFVLAGSPVDRAASNENYAESGQVIADASILGLVGDRATALPIAPETECVLTIEPTSPPAQSPLNYSNLTEQQQQALLDVITAYLPPKLYEDLASKGSLIGDHRPVTSLFVYFAGLDYDHDADVGAKLQTYVTRSQEIIYRYDGTLNRVLTGDKGSEMHILFGAPVAHEDDKARALRCALALQQVPSELAFIRAQRIGLASGYVFAGPVGAVAEQQQITAEGQLPVARAEYTVMGDIVNLSARLTGVCPPRQVIVDAYIRSRTAQRFEFRSFGPVKLKGKAQPVAPYLLERERPTENTLATRYLLSRRPLVGRSNEMATVREAVTDALGGKGRVLAITGLAGVGKSRLMEEAVRLWLQGHGVGFGGDCVSHGAETPYLPWADLWRAQFDLREKDSPQERLEKILRFGRGLGLDLSEWAALVGGILGLSPYPLGEEHPALAPLDPQARHRRLLDLTADLIGAQAGRTPILLLFEDLHWADRSSLELIDHVSERIADLPILICMAYRPHASVGLTCLERPICRRLQVGELSAQEEKDLIHAMLGDVALPAAFVQLVNSKAQGNPLFVEEFVKGLVDAGLLQRDNGRYHIVDSLERVEIPDTLEAVLLARIDQLAVPSRDVLRVASVVGRQFAYGVLRGIYPYEMLEAEMLERLEDLERLDLTRLERPEPELEYLFKHALTQDVAYESLPFILRRDLHQRIGRFLEQHYGDRLETMYGTLAHHFSRGGQTKQALSYALAAGGQAQVLFANAEALAHYRQAENLLAQLPIHEHEPEAMQLYLSRGDLHTLMGNFDEAEADLERGLELAADAQWARAQAQALNGLAYLRYWQTRNEETVQMARRALSLAKAGDHRREMMMALYYIGMALDELKDRSAAIEYYEQARTLAETLGDRRTLSAIQMGIAVAAFNQGRLRSALEALEGLLVICRASGDKHRVSNCLSNIANTLYYLGDWERARAAFQESIAINREIGKRIGLAYSLSDLGTLCCHQGDYAAGLAALEEAVDIFEEIGDDSGRAYGELTLGRGYYLDVGPEEEAERLLSRALPVLRAGESHEQETEALLALGRLHLGRGEPDRVRAELEQALALCQQHNLYWQRPEATVHLAELALAQGDAAKARDLAERTLGEIADGGCPDLSPAAHLVLARLADEPLQHYESAVDSARQRSRRIDLARTLVEVGGYLRDRPETELRAQGRAYLGEAQTMLEEIGLPSDASPG